MRWKDIPNYEGFYKVSNKGEIKSLKGKKPKILKGGIEGGGYKFVCLSFKNKVRNHKIHREVAKAFIENSKKLKEVNHINGIKTDNRVCNLEWVTPSNNIKHAYKTGLIKNRSGINNPNNKISENIAIKIKKYLKKGLYPTEISRKLDISREIVRSISRGKTWIYLNV